MFYAIRHFTRYRYSRPIWQSLMEVRMHPRNEGGQRCYTFQLSVSPRARIFFYADHLSNLVHHFDVPERHQQLTIIADALVDVEAPPPLPDSLEANAWDQLDRLVQTEDHWEMLDGSYFARTSPELEAFARDYNLDKRNGRDPIELLLSMNSTLFEAFAYVKKSTSVDSPIEDALRARQGVCQDFAHIMIALLRNLRIPARYVSGYLHHSFQHADRSVDGATHAWIEAMLPGLGWIGLDPTNNLIVGDRHIRTALGRDYADVPPTMGTMKGSADTELQVRVRVSPSDAVLPPGQEFAADEEWSCFLANDHEAEMALMQQQQQQ